MAALPPSIVVKIDPEAAEVLKALAGRIDKLLEAIERMEKNPPAPIVIHMGDHPVIQPYQPFTAPVWPYPTWWPQVTCCANPSPISLNGVAEAVAKD